MEVLDAPSRVPSVRGAGGFGTWVGGTRGSGGRLRSMRVAAGCVRGSEASPFSTGGCGGPFSLLTLI